MTLVKCKHGIEYYYVDTATSGFALDEIFEEIKAKYDNVNHPIYINDARVLIIYDDGVNYNEIYRYLYNNYHWNKKRVVSGKGYSLYMTEE